MGEMKLTLSIKQPWAWLVVQGLKDVENRKWGTNYRGQLLVHAGKSRPSEESIRNIERRYKVKIPRSDLRYGGIIGEVTVTGCVNYHLSRWFDGSGFGFVLANARPLPFRAIRGRLGFFYVP